MTEKRDTIGTTLWLGVATTATLALAGWALSRTVDHSSRLSTIEADGANTRQSLQRIETKLDHVIERR